MGRFPSAKDADDAGIGGLIIARILSAIGKRRRNTFSTTKDNDRNQLLGPTVTQFRVRIGVGPMTIDTVILKATAAKLTVTVKTYIKMVSAEILFASRAEHRRMCIANEAQFILWPNID